MNPKALPRNRLLGSIDIDTREWSDGVLTYAARQVGYTFLIIIIVLKKLLTRLNTFFPPRPKTVGRV